MSETSKVFAVAVVLLGIAALFYWRGEKKGNIDDYGSFNAGGFQLFLGFGALAFVIFLIKACAAAYAAP